MIAHQHPDMHPPTKAPVRLFHQIRPREPVLVVNVCYLGLTPKQTVIWD